MFFSPALRSAACWLFCLIEFSTLVSAQSIDEIPIEAPEGWRKERIVLPPSFAPAMKFQGQEEIRFAPGMFRSDAEDFFSYVIVFRLKNEKLPDDKQLNQEVLTYYRGLAQAVSKGTIETDKFALDLKPIEKPLKGKTHREAVGTLSWMEPFVTKTEQSLRIESRVWSHDDRHWIFLCVSPQPPEHAVWKSLHKIRDTFFGKHSN